MKKTLLINGRVVLPDEVRDGVAVLIEDGMISALDPSFVGSAEVFDLGGRILMPGMIDLHCDALEKEVEPRPGVHFPLDFACAQADKRNAAAGITTVFHAISFANHELGVRNNAFATDITCAVYAFQTHALVDNRVHARYEVTDESGPDFLTAMLENGDIHLLSFMDHTPGQGQFKDIAAYRTFLSSTYNKSEAGLDEILANKEASSHGALERMRKLSVTARQCGVAIASHDDDCTEKVETLAQLGAGISEFPVNMESAVAAKSEGIVTLFGAPNILRGRSQSGSMRALDGIIEGVADCLCGDYSPAALLPSVVRIPELTDISLASAVAMVTRNPARAVGLSDRGEIAPGKCADLVEVNFLGNLPQAKRTWVRGTPVLSAFFDHR